MWISSDLPNSRCAAHLESVAGFLWSVLGNSQPLSLQILLLPRSLLTSSGILIPCILTWVSDVAFPFSVHAVIWTPSPDVASSDLWCSIPDTGRDLTIPKVVYGLREVAQRLVYYAYSFGSDLWDPNRRSELFSGALFLSRPWPSIFACPALWDCATS